MNKINYDKINHNRFGTKAYAEYNYIKKMASGNRKVVKYRTNYISTIDIPYAKYVLK